jgi:hypothetical protein
MRANNADESHHGEETLVESAEEMPSKVAIGGAKNKRERVDAGQNSLFIQ